MKVTCMAAAGWVLPAERVVSEGFFSLWGGLVVGHVMAADSAVGARVWLEGCWGGPVPRWKALCGALVGMAPSVCPPWARLPQDCQLREGTAKPMSLEGYERLRSGLCHGPALLCLLGALL